MLSWNCHLLQSSLTQPKPLPYYSSFEALQSQFSPFYWFLQLLQVGVCQFWGNIFTTCQEQGHQRQGHNKAAAVIFHLNPAASSLVFGGYVINDVLNMLTPPPPTHHSVSAFSLVMFHIGISNISPIKTPSKPWSVISSSPLFTPQHYHIKHGLVQPILGPSSVSTVLIKLTKHNKSCIDKLRLN